MESESQTNNRTRGGRRVRPTRRAKDAEMQLAAIEQQESASMAHSNSADAASFSLEPQSGDGVSQAPVEAIVAAQKETAAAAAPAAVGSEAEAEADPETAAEAVTVATLAGKETKSSSSAAAPLEGKIPSTQLQQTPTQSAYQPQSTTNKGELQTPLDSLLTQATGALARSSRNTKKTRKTNASNKSAHKGPYPQKRKVQAQTPAQPKPTFETADPELHPSRLSVYPWEYPRPTDFLNLSDQRKAWKASADEAQGEVDTDPELDDWNEFSVYRSDLVPNLPVNYSIGLNFVSRAKRAFRAGRSWADFEQEELAIDSMAGARAIENRRERAIAKAYALDNDLRLRVFDQIKVRLCHEIWLEEYPELVETTEADDRSTKRDSVINSSAATPSSSAHHVMEPPGTANTFAGLGTGSDFNARPEKQLRTRPELPGDRELHQPIGPRVRATPASLRGFRMTYRESLSAIQQEMATSSEEE